MKKYILIKYMSLVAAGVIVGSFAENYSLCILLLGVPIIGLIYSNNKIYNYEQKEKSKKVR